jgi:predicted Zn-dependent peptidase
VKYLLLLTALSLSAQIKMPPFQKTVLPNGATLMLMQKRDLPLISVRVTAKGGAEAEPEGRAGLASLASDLLTQGTKTRSREALAVEVDDLGARLSAFSGRQSSTVFMEFLAKDTTKALAILEDTIKNPLFAEEEFRRLVARRLDSIKAGRDQPQGVVNEQYMAFFYGPDHPYGKPRAGDEASVRAMKRDEVAAFHQRLFVGKNLIVTVTGDFEPSAMEAKMKSLVGTLPPGEPYVWKKYPPVKPASSPRLLLIDKPDATQTYFIIGQPGLERTHPDRTTIDLVNTLFGGRFTSMLNDSLRVDSGLTYGAGSTVEQDRLPGSIYISTFTKNESTAKAIDLALAQLVKLRTTGLNAEALASAKAYLKGSYPTSKLETSDQLANVLTEFELFGLNRGEVDDLISRIDSVTLEQANAVAKRYYRTEGLVFVLVGKAAEIRQSIGKYAQEMVEIPITRTGTGQ